MGIAKKGLLVAGAGAGLGAVFLLSMGAAMAGMRLIDSLGRVLG
jgi:hypothetical protein